MSPRCVEGDPALAHGAPLEWAVRCFSDPMLVQLLRPVDAAWHKAGCPGSDADPRPEAKRHPLFIAVTAAWRGMQDQVFGRLRSGELLARGRVGTVLSDWTSIPPDSWGTLRVTDLDAGTVEGGGVILHSVRVAKPGGVPLDIAMRIFGDPMLVDRFEAAEWAAAPSHPGGGLPPYVPPSLGRNAPETAAGLRERLEAELFGHLAAGTLVGREASGNTLTPIPPERWQGLAADPDGREDRAWMDEVLVIPAGFAPPHSPSKPTAKAHTTADESGCTRWLIDEWPRAPARTKDRWRAEADREWPALSNEGFERAWAEARKQHPEMGAQGRRKRS